MNTSLTWESVSWRCGPDRFTFEIERGGLFATIKAPGNRSLTLPMVAWEGLLDALRANRATKSRSEQQFPVRSGSRWYAGEAEELAKSYVAGSSIATLAKAHHRTEYAIENQLDKMGLFSKAEKYGANAGYAGKHDAGTPRAVHPLDAPLERGHDDGSSNDDASSNVTRSQCDTLSHSPTR